MRCIGDPFGFADCIHTATAFVFGAIPAEDGSPLIVAVPCCDVHAPLTFDWVAQQSPIPEVEAFPIEALEPLQERMAQEGDELWLYTHAAA